MTERKIVYGTADTQAVAPWGVPVFVRLGSHWDADDPIVKAFPSLFTDDPGVGISTSVPPPHVVDRVIIGPETPPVEQATAAPGEKRATRRQG